MTAQSVAHRRSRRGPAAPNPGGSARGRGDRAVARPARYLALSIVTGGLAQLGLVVAYAGFGWGPTAAVLFSLAVSVGPSYWGCRTYVWTGLGAERIRSEAAAFLAVAAAGTATAVLLTHLAVLAGRQVTDDRAVLALWASAGSLAATAVVWVARYVVLDRAVFRRRSPHPPPPDL